MKATIKLDPPKNTPVCITLFTNLEEIRELLLNIEEINRWPNLQFKTALKAALVDIIAQTDDTRSTT